MPFYGDIALQLALVGNICHVPSATNMLHACLQAIDIIGKLPLQQAATTVAACVYFR